MGNLKCKEIIDKELRDRGHEADIDTLFDEIVYRSGLLREHDNDLAFVHLLLQEFFAGRAIPSLEFLGRVVSDVWWTKAVVFYFGENPDDSHGLAALREGIEGIIGGDEFQAAITVGLAAQACYLMKSNEKSEALRWVVDKLAECQSEVLKELSGRFKGTRLLPMLHYYLYGRDAVAAKVIADVTEEITKETNHSGQLSPMKESRFFWCIAGLIESKQLDKALELVKSFDPEDPRLLLALHLGSYYVQEMHVASARQKKTARKICTTLDPKMNYMRPEVIKELKGILLEVRAGDVKALDSGHS